MRLLQLSDKITKAVMLELAQQSLGNVSRNVAAARSLADLGGEPLRNMADSFSVLADSLMPQSYQWWDRWLRACPRGTANDRTPRVLGILR